MSGVSAPDSVVGSRDSYGERSDEDHGDDSVSSYSDNSTDGAGEEREQIGKKAIGGVRRGEVVEVYGPPGVGKTTFWYVMA